MSEEMLESVSNKSTTTFDPARKASEVVLTQVNLRADCGNSGGLVYANKSRSSGKWYFELTINLFEGNQQWSPAFGLMPLGTNYSLPWLNDVGELLWYSIPPGDLIFIYRNNLRSTYPLKMLQGNIVGVAVDLDAKTLQICVNGVFGPVFNYAPYTSVVEFYPVAASSGGKTATHSIVTWRDYPLYCPPGYKLW